MMQKQAKAFRAKAKPLMAKALRDDYPTPGYSVVVPVLGDINGDWRR